MKLFKNILYVSEPSVAQTASIARAVSLAENNQADLTVIEVIPTIAVGSDMPHGCPLASELQSAMTSEHRKVLMSLVEPYKKRLSIRLEVLVGRTFLEVVRAVLRDNYDLLIKPAENPNFIERLFGSDDMQLLRNCPCPVWLTRAEEKSNYANILAAVNFDPDRPDATEPDLNQLILELSGSLALSDFAALHLVHVWDAPAEALVHAWADNPQETTNAYVEGVRSSRERALHRLREQLRGQLGSEAYKDLSPQFHLRRGITSRAIPEMVKALRADLVVMGTVARSGIAGLVMGNTAEAILEQVQCSVLAVKPFGFVSPVRLAK